MNAKNPYESCRGIFVEKAYSKGYTHAQFFKMPEDFPEWNQFEGFNNLVDFEIEAGCISRAIIVLSESPGAFAELGAFCMDKSLRERLFIVVAKDHYDSDSFISLGPIKLIEDDFPDHAICVVDSTKTPQEFEANIDDILVALSEKLDTAHKSQTFNSDITRDQYLLIADLINLFCALTLSEIQDLLAHMKINVDQTRLKLILKQLRLFGLIVEHQITTRRYFISVKDAENHFIDYKSQDTKENFDRIRFKMNIFQSLSADRFRSNAFKQAQGNLS